jgi:RNA polymerase sigma factor (TIGR02999 family)
MSDEPRRDTANATALWLASRAGDPAALDRLLPVLYHELAGIAHRSLSGERRDHTLQTRALVHEAYLRLIDVPIAYQDRVHFLAVAARTMRQVLVDHARARGRVKRGSGAVRVDLTELALSTPSTPFDVLALHDALERLAEYDARKAQIIELQFFGGLTQEETAETVGISLRTVERELRAAKALLRHDLESTR